MYLVNPLSASVALCPHIETSQLICHANQLTGFYMRATLALDRLSTYAKSSEKLTKIPSDTYRYKMLVFQKILRTY